MIQSLVMRGQPGKRRCAIHMIDCYVDVFPHALAPNPEKPLMVEYVRNGRLLGCAFMSEEGAMQFQLGLIRIEHKAHSFLVCMLQGSTPFAGNVRDIAQLNY